MRSEVAWRHSGNSHWPDQIQPENMKMYCGFIGILTLELNTVKEMRMAVNQGVFR